MLLKRWIANLFDKPVPARARRDRPELSPVPQRVEKLEQRALLSAIGGAQVVELPSFQVDASSYAESHILVRFKEEAQVPAEAEGGELMRGTNIHKVRIGQGSTVAQAVEAFQHRPDVVYAQPDYTLHVLGHMVPNDALYNNGGLWGLNNTGQNSGTPDADIDAPEAWHLTTGNRSIVVGVIDTGVDHTHPDMMPNIWVNPGEIAGDGIDNDSNGYVDDIHGYDFVNNDGDPMDDNGHGSHVSGTIGARANNGGSSGTDVVGVAWDVSIMGLKFLSSSGSGSSSNAIRALDYVKTMRELYVSTGGSKGANVLLTNNSWGGGGYDQALKDAIDANDETGILFVAAAGNGDFLGRAQNNDTSPSYPASYDSANIIAVAATDRNDKFASFSNYGATSVDLAAPGVEIWSTIPFNKDTSDGSKDGYARYNGTSMATPHVSGAIALAWAANPELTAAEVKQIILGTTDYIGDKNPDRPTVTNGRLNAAKAVSRALELGTPSLAISDATVTEGNSETFQAAVFTVTRSGDTSQTVTVDYATEDRTATVAGTDYQATSGTLTFGTGETSKTITVLVYGDDVEEPHETFYLNLSNVSTNAAVADSRGVGTINDDDGPAISIADVTVTEGNTGTTNAVVAVSLSKASIFDVTVSYATADGSATTADKDYAAISGMVRIPAGSTTGTITVAVNGDTAYEPDETFFVNLSNATHGTLVDAQGKATIVNDDTQPAGDANEMYVADISWSERHYGRWQDLYTAVDLNRDSNKSGAANDGDERVAGATVYLDLVYDMDGDGFDDGRWTGTGTTDSTGRVVFTLSKTRDGVYRATVTKVEYAGHFWDGSLDQDNPSTYDTKSNAEVKAGTVALSGGAEIRIPTADQETDFAAGDSVRAGAPSDGMFLLLSTDNVAGPTFPSQRTGTDSDSSAARDQLAAAPPTSLGTAHELTLDALDAVFADDLLAGALLSPAVR